LQSIFFAEDRIENVTVIHAENTVGKTSILNAFRFVLYANPESKGKRIELSQLMNRKALREGQSDFEVELRFTSNGQSYEISRKGWKEGTEWISTATLKIDQSAIPRDQIEKRINEIAPQEISRFFLFDGELLEEYEALLDQDNHDAEKIKSSIEKVLGVPSLLSALEAVESSVSYFRKAQVEEDRKGQAEKQAAGVLKQLMEDKSKSVLDRDGIQGDLGRVVRDLAVLRERLSKHQEKFKEHEEMKQTEGMRDVIVSNLKAKEGEHRESLSRLWLSLCKNRIVSCLPQSSGRSLDEDFLKNLIGQAISDCACPVCENSLNDHSIRALHEKLSAISEVKDSIGIKSLKSALAEINIRDDSVPSLESIRQEEAAIIYMERDRDDYNDKIKELALRLKGFGAEEVQLMYKQEAALESQKENLDSSLSRILGKIQEIDNNMAIQDKIIASGEGVAGRTSRYVSTGVAIEQALRSSVEKLRNELRQIVERKASDAFMNFTTRHRDYRGLRINENYGLEIINADDEVVPLRSAGASQIVALSLIMGLNNTGKSPGPVIMDTPFGRLDLGHRSKIVEFMPKSARQFVVFVHSGELDPKSDVYLKSLSERVGKSYEVRSLDSDYSEIGASL
jgi:DNA sulfur modification protein DndD